MVRLQILYPTNLRKKSRKHLIIFIFILRGVGVDFVCMKKIKVEKLSHDITFLFFSNFFIEFFDISSITKPTQLFWDILFTFNLWLIWPILTTIYLIFINARV